MPGVRSDPRYPFSEANLEETVHVIDSFIADPSLTSEERGEVLEFVRLTRQYAFLEEMVQGQVLFDLPIHFALAHEVFPSVSVQAERTAVREGGLLELGMEPAVTLQDALDDRGIKIFRRGHGPESPDKLTGGFHYAGEFGPSLLVGGVEGCPDALFVLAHEYAHLVMDIDPYESRFCRWNRRDLGNANGSMEEQRADHFARALLLPAETVKTFAAELGLDGSKGELTEERMSRAAEVLGVAPAVLWRRMQDLSLPALTTPPEPLSMDDCREVDDKRPTDLPERFVNLALAAFGTRIIEKGDLARFLRIPPDRLEGFLAWSPIPREPKPLRDRESEERGEATEG